MTGTEAQLHHDISTKLGLISNRCGDELTGFLSKVYEEDSMP
jgi:hypothetical protein